MESSEIVKIVESLLFATESPLPLNRIKDVIGGITPNDVKKSIEQLNKEYEEQGKPFSIQEISGGYQIRTKGEYNQWIQKLTKQKDDTKLSNAAMEVLAIIAYKQPIIRAEVEAIRGVDSSGIIRALMDKKLLKITGRSEELGHPLLYGTAPSFLELLGLNSIQDLPKPVELK
jgi:segregation and condensation protein B